MAEVYTFIAVGDAVGVLLTLFLCLITAMIGGFLVRLQGLGTLMKAQNNLRTGKIPVNEIFDGFCIVVAGVLLITPGFVTDFIGFSLLIPPFRAILQRFLSKNAKYSIHTAQYGQNNPDSDVIEGNYEQVDKNTPPLDHAPKDN